MQFTLRIAGMLVCGLSLCATVKAQETADGPTLQQENPPAATVVEELPSNAAAPAGDDQRWRYRQHDGRWWYWLPSNRWVVWIDGRWVDPPVESMTVGPMDVPQYQAAPQYVVPRATGRVLTPRPRSWYYTDRTYDGPYYYYDEFYSPYGGARPYPYYPTPRPYSRNVYGGYPYGYPSGYPYYGSGAGFSIGGGRGGVRIGVGF
jgi:hypothetical protein